MAFCTTCGAPLSGAFCTKCGAPVAAAQGPAAGPPAAGQFVPGAAPVPRKTSPIVWVLVAILAFFLIGGLVTAGILGLVVHRARQAGVSFDRHNNGRFSITARGADGKNATVEFGGSANQLPSWVPEYPGSKPVLAVRATGEGIRAGEGGNFTFTTSDSAATVLSFYEDKCKDLGMKVNLTTTSDEGGMIVASDDHDRGRSLTVVVGGSGRTSVNVTYASK